MLERKWLGDKTKGGFYKKMKGAAARTTSAWRSIGRRWNIIRARSRNSPRSIWRKNVDETGARVRMLLGLDGAAARRRPTKPALSSGPRSADLWTYSANRIPEISDSIVEIDRAMHMGFNWELGPVRTLGCRWRGSHRRAHEERRPSGRGQRRKAARLRPKVLVRGRSESRRPAASISIWQLATGNR